MMEDPDSFDAGDRNLYRYVGNNVVNATDPSGKQIRIYRSKWVWSSGLGGHHSIVWYDPKKDRGIVFDGGGASPSGSGSSGLPVPKRYPYFGEGFIDFSNVDNIRDKVIAKHFEVYSDPPARFVATMMSAEDELLALDDSFYFTKQIPFYYAATGPNSNTWAKQWLLNAGFKVAQPPGAWGWHVDNKDYDYDGKYWSKWGSPKAAARDLLWYPGNPFSYARWQLHRQLAAHEGYYTYAPDPYDSDLYKLGILRDTRSEAQKELDRIMRLQYHEPDRFDW
jgi:hypothetical protein